MYLEGKISGSILGRTRNDCEEGWSSFSRWKEHRLKTWMGTEYIEGKDFAEE